MSDSMKDILDKVAASPDQRVRGMAIRYKQAEQEMEHLAAFFAIYAETAGVTSLPMSSSSSASTTARRPHTGRGRRPANGSEAFGSTVSEIIDKYGRPMPLNDMYSSYLQENPDHVIAFETFRQKVIKHRELFRSMRGQGYWLVSKDVPADVAA